MKPFQISCCCGDFTSWEITSGGGVEEYETGWQSDIITDELGIVYLSNHFHGDCAKVAFVTDQFSCYKFIKIDLLQKGFTREMLATMRIKLRFAPNLARMPRIATGNGWKLSKNLM